MKKEQTFHWLQSQIQKLGQYKYAILVLAVGIGLMLLPQGEKRLSDEKVEDEQPDTTLEQRLEEILSQIDGAGEVQVLLTLDTGFSYEFQADEQSVQDTDGTQLRTETVLVSSDGQEGPVTAKTVYPTYKGAVVVCQGGDRASVRYDIVRAVSGLTGLGSDKITVIKMKER